MSSNEQPQTETLILLDGLEEAVRKLASFFELSEANFFELLRPDADQPVTDALLEEVLRKHFLLDACGEPFNGEVFVAVSKDGHLQFVDWQDAEQEQAEALHGGFRLCFRLTKRNIRHGDGAIKSTLSNHWFWGALLDNRLAYSQVIIAAVFINLFALASSVFVMTVYDRVIPNNATDSLLALTLGVGIVILFDFILKTLRAVFIDQAGARIDKRIASDMFDNLVAGRFQTGRMSTGAFSNTLREFEGLKDMFASATVAAVVDLPFILLFMWVVYAIGGDIVLVPAVLVPLVLLVGIVLQPLLARHSKDSYKDGQSKQSVLVETVSGLETVRTLPATSFLKRRWVESVEHHSQTNLKSRSLTQFASHVTGSSQQIMQVALVFYGVFLIAEAELSMGALVACVIISGRIVAPLAQLSNLMTRIHYSITSYRGLNDLFKQRHAINHEVSLTRETLKGRIEFRNVGFRYDENSDYVVKDLSFVIRPGEHVALLGRIGSGKSTVLKMMLGLLEPTEGQILIDDTDIRQLHKLDLAERIGTVLQESFLFSGTIRQNIAVGARQASDEQVLRAAQVSGAHNFIGKMPQGYDSVLAEKGSSLSGGQRQAIALARAMVSHPSMLMLDEPTSSMDMTTELQILRNLKQYSEGRTVVVTTHRSSVLAVVDRVLVLDEGRLVGDGPKDQVMKAANSRQEEAAHAPS